MLTKFINENREEKIDVRQYIDEITCEKPRAEVYIDDKAVRFQNWNHCLEGLEVLNII